MKESSISPSRLKVPIGRSACSFSAPSAQLGMTLVELMVVSTLTVFVISGMIYAVVTGLRINYTNAQHVVAFGRCVEAVEELREIPYDSIASAAPQSIRLTHLGGFDAVSITGVVQCTVAEITTNGPKHKHVTVTVGWTYRGTNRSETVETSFYRLVQD